MSAALPRGLAAHETSASLLPEETLVALPRESLPADRTPEQLLEQYLAEKELASLLLRASRTERTRLYSWAYEELFRRIAHHPQLSKKASPEQRALCIARQVHFLDRWLTPDTVFLEIGAGDCALSFAVARKAAHVYAIDVSSAITSSAAQPANFTLVLSDGTSIPTPEERVTVAYSNQLMEHLHPDDALLQLKNIYRALAPGGAYICVTPNRLSGPHDISRYFDTVATGFHLKEYTASELISMFRSAGFRSVHQWIRTRAGAVCVPNALTRSLERAVAWMRPVLPRRALTSRAMRSLLEIRLVARK